MEATLAVPETSISRESYLAEQPEAEEELSQVDARTGRQRIFSYTSGGDLMEIGQVRYRDYEGNRAVRHLVLESKLSGREHSLGAASSGFRSFSHSDVLDPFLKAGFEVRKALHARGGASLIAILGNPTRTWQDVISWDKAVGVGDSDAENGLELSVRIHSDLRRGHGVRADLGFYRLICSNGLIAKILDLGSLRTSHRGFALDQVNSFIQSKVKSPEELPTAPSECMEEILPLLDRLDDEEFVLSQPRLLRTPMKALSSGLSKATTSALRQQLSDMTQSKEDYSVLDLLNAQTNLATTARTPWSVYSETDTAVKALVDLTELVGVKQGVRTFEPN